MKELPEEIRRIGNITDAYSVHATFHWDRQHQLRVATVHMNALAWEEVLQALKNGGLSKLALALEEYQRGADFQNSLETSIETEHVPTNVPWL